MLMSEQYQGPEATPNREAGMNNKQVRDFIVRAQSTLQLRDWNITFVPIEASVVDADENIALLHTRVHSLDARITVAMRQHDADIKKAIWHELSHLLLKELRDIADDIARQLGPAGERLARDRLDVAEEHIVTRLERALGDRL